MGVILGTTERSCVSFLLCKGFGCLVCRSLAVTSVSGVSNVSGFLLGISKRQPTCISICLKPLWPQEKDCPQTVLLHSFFLLCLYTNIRQFPVVRVALPIWVISTFSTHSITLPSQTIATCHINLAHFNSTDTSRQLTDLFLKNIPWQTFFLMLPPFVHYVWGYYVI